MITAIAHPWLKRLRLLQKRAARVDKKLFVGEGNRLLREAVSALDSHAPLQEILFVLYLAEWAEKEDGKQLLKLLQREKIPLDVVSPRLFSTHSATETPQGVLFVGRLSVPPFDQWAPQKGDLVLVADGVQDPGNVGTMIRSAFASGCGAFLATRGTVDLYNSKVVRSSAGAIFHLPTFPELGFSEIAEKAKNVGLPLFIAQTDTGESWDAVPFGKGGMIVVGNEGAGVSPFWKKIDAIPIRIPMREGAESINAAMAATVICFTAMRKEQ